MAMVVVSMVLYGNFKDRMVCKRSSGLMVSVIIAKAEIIDKSRRDIPRPKNKDSNVILIVPKIGISVTLYKIVEPC